MALVAGALAVGADFQNLTVQNHAPLDSGTTTSTSYTTTRASATSPVGKAFVAPPSGKVLIHWACGLQAPGTVDFVLCAFQIRTGTTLGSGTSVAAASDNRALQSTNTTAEKQAGRSGLVTGLTAGNDYNVTLMYRVSGGTGTISRIEVTVHPCIA